MFLTKKTDDQAEHQHALRKRGWRDPGISSFANKLMRKTANKFTLKRLLVSKKFQSIMSFSACANIV
jgi:hypothetical protein